MPRPQPLRVLIELISSDRRIGAVNDVLDLAHYSAGPHVQYFLCGAVDASLARVARVEGMTIVRGRSRTISKRNAIPYLLNVLTWVVHLLWLRPGVVHLNYAGHGPSLACAARLLRIPVVSRAGGEFHADNPLNRWTAAYVANCHAHASAILASPLAERVRITGDLFRPERLEGQTLGRPLPPRSHRPRFMFLGQLVERKGIAVLIRAFARMSEDAELLLVGGDWNSPGHPQELRRLIADLGIQARVHCDNHREDIAALLTASDVLVLPSLGEARPRVIIEAMCLGRPVIASAVGGIPEMIDAGLSGLLVAPNDIDALSSALDQLAGSTGLRTTMGEAARQHARRAFHPERTVERYLELYRELAHAHRPVTV